MPLSSCLCVLPVDLVFVTFILVLVCLCLWLSLAFSVLNIVDPDGRIKGYSPQYWKDRKYVLWKQQRNIVGRINNFILYIHIQVECFSTFKLGLFFFFQRSLRSRRFTVGSHFFYLLSRDGTSFMIMSQHSVPCFWVCQNNTMHSSHPSWKILFPRWLP